MNPGGIVPIRQNEMSALYVDAFAYERVNTMTNFAFAFLRRCAGNVAQFVEAVRTAFSFFYIDVSRVQQWLEGMPQQYSEVCVYCGCCSRGSREF